MTRPVERLLERLEKVKKTATGWTGQCPAHEDKNPSLSISEGRDGRALLNCHAGCSTDAICAAIGLSLSDLFYQNGHRAEWGCIVAAYPYENENGELLSQVVRLEPKGFRQRRPDGAGGWVWNLEGVKRIPYRLPKVIKAVEAVQTIYVVEGEQDVEGIERLGLAATCNPGGALKWRSEYSEYLRGASVVVIPDKDEAGRKHASAVASSLRDVAADVQVLELPGAGKDASDWIAECERDGKKPAEIKDELERLVATSATSDVEPSVPSVFRSLADLLSNPGALDPPKPVVPRLAWRGRSTLLAAREKDGKSTLAAIAAARVSTGREFLEGPCVPGNVVWVGLEEHKADIAARFQKYGADPERIFIANRLEDQFHDLEKIVKEVRPVLIVVDTLAAFAEGLVKDPNSSAQWTPVMARLNRIARDFDVATWLNGHAKKSDGAYRDSTAIGAGVDVILEMRSDPSEPEVRHLTAKARFGVPRTSIRFTGDSYELTSGKRSLEDRILASVGGRPGCSLRQVREGVAGKAGDIGDAVKKLLTAGSLENRGTGNAYELYVGGSQTQYEYQEEGTTQKPCSHQGISSTHETTGNRSGTTREPEVVPEKTLMEQGGNHPGTTLGTSTGSWIHTLERPPGTTQTDDLERGFL